MKLNAAEAIAAKALPTGFPLHTTTEMEAETLPSNGFTLGTRFLLIDESFRAPLAPERRRFAALKGSKRSIVCLFELSVRIDLLRSRHIP